MIIPKSDTKTVAKIKAAIEAACAEDASKLKSNSKSVPPLASIKTPLHDGDEERPDDPAYSNAYFINAYFINANSTTSPGIVDADLNPVLTRSEVYSGIYSRASITLYAFNSNGNRGIACGLNNLELIRAGESLCGKASAESDFATNADEDFLNYGKERQTIESTVMISSLLCNILIGCFRIMVFSWAVVAVQTFINDFKREKREKKKAVEDDEYHEKRMEAMK